jgi:hypothetical protein
MADKTTEQASPGVGPSAPRPASPAGRTFWQRAGARAVGWLRGFWYGFQRLFGLDSCPIDQVPGAGRPPGPPSPTDRVHHGSQNSAADRAPAVRSDRS